MSDMSEITLGTLLPELRSHTTESQGCALKSYSHDTGSGPVLCMVHGYPQSAYMWRHVVPMLKDKVSMFIAELPGYGISSLPPQPDKRTVGNIIMEGLKSVFSDRPVVWCGHDRGGRVGHRLMVDNDPKHNIVSGILLDIVPTLEQWRAFANPAAAVAYYHWPFLATQMAPSLIEAVGGRIYCLNNFDRTKGSNTAAITKLKENDALDHYSTVFSKPETISGSCADYASAAEGEPKEQEDDQARGKKIKVPTMVLYSASNLGQMHNVEALWKNWVDGDLKCVALGDDVGHYLPEEAPEQTAKLIADFAAKNSK
ncbi:alpha/beta hydrolase [Hortaea werneckii]|uniref:AB hydrolase-1 domain-containing protein n=1 Tax=Hortaea werneckii TaxID=91943 RepID=A0A3M7GM54_HORWE|nr:alpha/beta hydrolase [Hortaea werneckii]KAI6869118.1 alpha/beta hydrolase [Hortaea werneckii]KAI7353241.1 alpha/beta hydrolase [Hortaea werneckii]RMY76465.1 hypothetical protein D0863_01923 [Hortaea werneckii]RMZ01857.1 hypothetical protein D0862_06209 [Hortaea werneckii]